MSSNPQLLNSSQAQRVNAPNPAATGCLIVGFIFAYFWMLKGSTPSEMAGRAAWVVAITLVGSIGLELKANWKAILRPDVICLAALFFLSFFEFLLPQPLFDSLAGQESTARAITICLIAYGVIGISRHFAPPAPRGLASLLARPGPPIFLLGLFWFAFFMGFFYMLLAVDFNIFVMIDQLTWPRFTQTWQRGRFGDMKTLLNEVGMILYLVPPLGGIILAGREKFKLVSVIGVLAALLFTLFQGYAGGTRNVLGSYLVTFLVGYALVLTKRRRLEFLILCGMAAIGFVFGSREMLKFREIGLKEYLAQSKQATPSFEDTSTDSFYVDYNLLMIAQISDQVPRAHPYTGWEIPYLALVRPIPRALWPGKPEGMSTTLEDLVSAEDQTTVSATFIGEAYVAGGIPGVMLAAAFFGILTAWWGRLASNLNSDFGLLIYASGFFSIVISMRSMLVLTTAMLPTIAAICMAAIFLRKHRATDDEDLAKIAPPAQS
jgi:hypothetical protein